MERVDGAQARLKQTWHKLCSPKDYRGKGGWGSGEIETRTPEDQARYDRCGKGGWGSGEIETLGI